MHSALKERLVKGSTAAACEIDETVKDQGPVVRKPINII